MIDLSIIIVNYRSKGLVKTCIRGVQKSNLKMSYEVIVVDNASNDGCIKMLNEEFPSVRGIQASENRGLAAGNNIGLRESTGKYLLIINPDIAVFEGMIEKLIAYIESHPQVAVAGPKLVNPDGTVQFSIYRFPTPITPLYRRTPLGHNSWAKRALRRYLMFDKQRDINGPVDWILGACMLVSRTAYEKIGEMDERFFLYFEDVDWCRRFWAAGYEVHYVPDAELIHYHRRLSAESPGLSGIFTKATRIHIQSWMRYFKKYFRIPLPPTGQS